MKSLTVKPGALVKWIGAYMDTMPIGLVLSEYKSNNKGWYVFCNNRKFIWFEDEFDVIQE